VTNGAGDTNHAGEEGVTKPGRETNPADYKYKEFGANDPGRIAAASSATSVLFHQLLELGDLAIVATRCLHMKKKHITNVFEKGWTIRIAKTDVICRIVTVLFWTGTEGFTTLHPKLAKRKGVRLVVVNEDATMLSVVTPTEVAAKSSELAPDPPAGWDSSACELLGRHIHTRI
jgi:hypothetical protein